MIDYDSNPWKPHWHFQLLNLTEELMSSVFVCLCFCSQDYAKKHSTNFHDNLWRGGAWNQERLHSILVGIHISGQMQDVCFHVLEHCVFHNIYWFLQEYSMDPYQNKENQVFLLDWYESNLVQIQIRTPTYIWKEMCPWRSACCLFSYHIACALIMYEHVWCMLEFTGFLRIQVVLFTDS